jgi:TnpA family transposase
MGQFYASLESGRTTASVALQRLVSCTAKNHFYRANRDLGRIFKTEFLLSYLSEPKLRARIRRGLLKVEQLHALARDIYYGRRGRINARELHEQMNSCSCLTLLLACVVYGFAPHPFQHRLAFFKCANTRWPGNCHRLVGRPPPNTPEVVRALKGER